MSFGAGALRVGGAGQQFWHGKEVSMATLRAATTTHCHTDRVNRILTQLILIIKQGWGGVGARIHKDPQVNTTAKHCKQAIAR